MNIVIFGTGEIAQMAHFYMTHDPAFEHRIVGFTCDDEYVAQREFLGCPVVPVSEVLERFPPNTHGMHVALSYTKLNQLRSSKYSQAKAMGYDLISYISSRSVVAESAKFGDNCLILENQTVQPNVRIGNNVMIWSGNHLGHGCEIGDHAYLSSHICVSGFTKIGKRCFVGVNAAFRDYISVGDDVFVAMGANVTGDVSEGSVVLGPRMSSYDRNHELTRKLRKAYLNLDN